MVHSVGMSPTCTLQDFFFCQANDMLKIKYNNTVSCDEVLIFKKAWLITWGEQGGVRSGIYSLSFC